MMFGRGIVSRSGSDYCDAVDGDIWERLFVYVDADPGPRWDDQFSIARFERGGQDAVGALGQLMLVFLYQEVRDRRHHLPGSGHADPSAHANVRGNRDPMRFAEMADLDRVRNVAAHDIRLCDTERSGLGDPGGELPRGAHGFSDRNRQIQRLDELSMSGKIFGRERSLEEFVVHFVDEATQPHRLIDTVSPQTVCEEPCVCID